MQVMYPCCCGLDIHKKFVVACVLTTADDGRVQKATRTFSTMTDDLLALLDWLATSGCTHVAMESTSSYVRRFTARAIPPAGGAGSEGYLWAND